MSDLNRSRIPATPEQWGCYMPVPAILSSGTTGWKHISARRYQHPPAEVAAPPLSDHLIFLVLSGVTNVEWRLEGEFAAGRIVPGQVSVMSANKLNDWRWDGRPDVLHVYMKPAFLDELAQQVDVQQVELVDRFGLDDPSVRQICLNVLKELTSIGFGGRLYGDFLAQALGIQLLRRHSVLWPKAKDTPSALPAYKLRRAIEFIDAHIAEDIGVNSIAEAASMSSYHFAHAFKKATGFSPHRYVVKQRIERARELLKHTDLPIIEIALSVGFATQNHFTTVFGKHCGVTPKQYRNSVKS